MAVRKFATRAASKSTNASDKGDKVPATLSTSTKNGTKTTAPTSADESQKSPSRNFGSQSRSDPKGTPSSPPASFLVLPRVSVSKPRR
jgi:hypothetical protein